MGKNLCTQAGGERATPSYPFIFSTPSFFFVPHPLEKERTNWCRSIPPPSTHSAISNRSASLFGFLEFHEYTELLFSPPPLYVTYQSISQTIISE